MPFVECTLVYSKEGIMNYNDMRILIKQMLGKTIDCWFYTCQSVLDIKDGGLAWDLDALIDKSIDNLCDACIDALKSQYDRTKRSTEAYEN